MRYLREKDVLRLLPIRRSTLRRWEARGQFPRRRELGPRCVGWRSDEIDAWLESRPQRGGQHA